MLGKSDHRPADVGRIYRIAVQAQLQIAATDVVAAVAGDARRRKPCSRALPPHRVAGELERPRETTHVCSRRAERLRDRLEREEGDQPTRVGGILQPYQRKQSVDFVEGRDFLVSVGNLDYCQSALG